MPTPFQQNHTAGYSAVVSRSLRYATNIPALAAILNHGKEKKLPNIVLRNISRSGARIFSGVPLTIGETIVLHFYLPESGLPFRAICDVIWSDSQGQCGLRFQEVSEQHRRRLNAWLTSKATEQ
jgi:hypothetical protein